MKLKYKGQRRHKVIVKGLHKQDKAKNNVGMDISCNVNCFRVCYYGPSIP